MSDAILLLACLTAASLPYADDAGRLGDERFLGREAASARLYSSLPDSLPAVWLATFSDDPEVRRRAGLILGCWHAGRWHQVETGWGERKWPWIDQLPPGYPRRVLIRDAYLARGELRCATPSHWGDYARYRGAARLWVLDRTYAGATPWECLTLLDRMAQWEAVTVHGSNTPDAAAKQGPATMAKVGE